MAKYLQGIFKPNHPEKYKGREDLIIYRSSYELKFLIWLDNNPSVIEYNSEEIVIPYKSPIDNRYHRYFTDMWFKTKDKDGNIKEYIVEIKPFKQTIEPKTPSKITKSYINEVKTWGVNQAKWEAANKYCEKKNMTFQILTEKDLFK